MYKYNIYQLCINIIIYYNNIDIINLLNNFLKKFQLLVLLLTVMNSNLLILKNHLNVR